MTDGGEERASAAALLVVDGISKQYRTGKVSIQLLDAVSLAVEPGEIVAVSGRSGSGKTTLLNIVAGWEQPDTGSVRFGDGSTGVAALGWRSIAMLPQGLGLLEELTIRENVTLPTRFAGPAGALDVQSLLWRLGLDQLADRRPGDVSLGEQQRAGLARALILRPALVVADEPVSHQNREWIEGLLHLVRELAAGGTACLLATHNHDVLGAVDRVIALERGHLHAA